MQGLSFAALPFEELSHFAIVRAASTKKAGNSAAETTPVSA
jgi:hypothetical protein